MRRDNLRAFILGIGLGLLLSALLGGVVLRVLIGILLVGLSFLVCGT